MTEPLEGRDSLPTLLLIDDDADLRDILVLLFEPEGYTVQTAADGSTGLALLRASQDRVVVLLDRLMPRLSGIDILRQVETEAALQRHAYLLLTASAQGQTAEEQALLERLGVPLIGKPFDVDSLLEAVKQAEQHVFQQYP